MDKSKTLFLFGGILSFLFFQYVFALAVFDFAQSKSFSFGFIWLPLWYLILFIAAILLIHFRPYSKKTFVVAAVYAVLPFIAYVILTACGKTVPDVGRLLTIGGLSLAVCAVYLIPVFKK